MGGRGRDGRKAEGGPLIRRPLSGATGGDVFAVGDDRKSATQPLHNALTMRADAAAYDIS